MTHWLQLSAWELTRHYTDVNRSCTSMSRQPLHPSEPADVPSVGLSTLGQPWFRNTSFTPQSQPSRACTYSITPAIATKGLTTFSFSEWEDKKEDKLPHHTAILPWLHAQSILEKKNHHSNTRCIHSFKLKERKHHQEKFSSSEPKYLLILVGFCSRTLLECFTRCVFVLTF